MEINTIKENDKGIAIIQSNEILIKDVHSALDFMMTVQYETEPFFLYWTPFREHSIELHKNLRSFCQ